MKLEDLQDAMGKLDDDIVTEAGKFRGRRTFPLWQKLGAAVAAISLILTGFIFVRIRRAGNLSPSAVVALATPEYPLMHKYPSEELLYGSKGDQEAFDKAYAAWTDEYQRLRQQPQNYRDGVLAMAQEANRLLLTAEDENRIYSPLNVYLALSLLAETSAGETQAEILHVLGVDSLKELRDNANSLWHAHYMDDGHTTSLLANSIWLDESLPINKEIMENLQNFYMAAAFQGDMNDDVMTDQLQKWLNEQTDSLLEYELSSAGFEKDTLMALVSTILFRAKWVEEFNEANTAKADFHSPHGRIETDFMSESGANTYYWGDNFAAVSKELIHAGRVWFFLPDEGVAIDELLDNHQVDALLQDSSVYEQQKYLVINFKLPKFDVTSEIQMEDALRDLGIKTAFTAAADFSPVSEYADLYVSSVKHAARVMVDEKGVTGAAYTLSLFGAAMPPDETVDFVLDRPFLFIVQGHDGVPLFIGTVNRP